MPRINALHTHTVLLLELISATCSCKSRVMAHVQARFDDSAATAPSKPRAHHEEMKQSEKGLRFRVTGRRSPSVHRRFFITAGDSMGNCFSARSAGSARLGGSVDGSKPHSLIEVKADATTTSQATTSLIGTHRHTATQRLHGGTPHMETEGTLCKQAHTGSQEAGPNCPTAHACSRTLPRAA